MGDLLMWLLAILLAGTVVTAATVSVALWRLRRRNRVCRGHRTLAPLAWLVLPTPAARLHRRLRGAVAVAHLAGGGAGVADLIAEVEQQAVAIDLHVVVTARLPRRERPRRLHHLDDQVSQLEALASRLVTSAAEAASNPALPGATVDPLARIGERLDALEAARADLAGLERGVGLEPAPPTLLREHR